MVMFLYLEIFLERNQQKLNDLPPIRFINNDKACFRTLFQDIHKDIWVLRYLPDSSLIYKVEKLDKRFNGICGNNPHLESKLITNIVKNRKEQYVSIISFLCSMIHILQRKRRI